MNDQTYVFEKNPMGEACPQVENTYTSSLQGRKHSKPDTAGHVQTRTIKEVFMFGGAAQKVTETKSSLPTLQILPSH